ncbi:ribose 5-phosphate isomerase B [Rickettsia endosymbiont of Cardiosporidium cionae]|uniref:ribose 5-phosphate isomerase B n=1 Tax=Rickettsia endosymbiont of Cardiosporidium cionae TaxID=2777155 RepID=UPI001894EEA1|nr:ribose 5-phosphate isomerase B [Rickettsia endosymbiont of Cardiosporidium cionae]KAF8818740.1 ribose 5-phosphate isomerase B [Rickettsia endosymbiont of Cardiosporidium cionae]
MNQYNLAIANDHRGFDLKTEIIRRFTSVRFGYKIQQFLDLGTHNKEPIDYPDLAKQLGDEIINEVVEFGVLICDTGIGMSIAANRYSEIRAALCFDLRMAELARLHNDANVLVLGASINSIDNAAAMVDKFLCTKFEGGRHRARVNKL